MREKSLHYDMKIPEFSSSKLKRYYMSRDVFGINKNSKLRMTKVKVRVTKMPMQKTYLENAVPVTSIF